MFGYGLNYESDQSNNSEYSLYGVSTSSFSGNGTLKTSMLNNIFYIRSNISQNDFLNLFFVYKFYIPIHGEFKFNSVLFSRPNLTFPSTIQMSSDSVYGNIHKITHKFEIGNNFILDNDSYLSASLIYILQNIKYNNLKQNYTYLPDISPSANEYITDNWIYTKFLKTNNIYLTFGICFKLK